MPADSVRVRDSDHGVVAIGRNEGERLQRCIRSARSSGVAAIVYVDSGSTDGSAGWARGQDVHVVDLDMRQPFTAARARNAGFAALRRLAPDLKWVQFVDGDCELAAGWLEAGLAILEARPDVAVVCGRRRERFPERSIYNRLCDFEWDTPIGEAKACGGDALMRAAALEAVGGYRDTLIAGEEPELCIRLRAAGWRIWRLDHDMTWHDAAMTRFVQWWRRAERAGYAYAEGASLHGAPPERHWVRQSRSAWAWGAMLPLLAVLAALLMHPAALALLLLYPLQWVRLVLTLDAGSARLRILRAMFLVLGKFPEALGQLRFAVHRLLGRRGRLIEYK